MDELALRHLGHVCIAFKDIAGTGKSALTFDQIAIETRPANTPPRTPTSRYASGCC